MSKLKEGDIVELQNGHKIEAKVPLHLYGQMIIDRGGSVGSGYIGNHKLEVEEITIGGVFDYFAGRYIVTRINHIPASGDNYAGGSAYDEIFCEHTSNPHLGRVRLLSWREVKSIGKAIKKWEMPQSLKSPDKDKVQG